MKVYCTYMTWENREIEILQKIFYIVSIIMKDHSKTTLVFYVYFGKDAEIVKDFVDTTNMKVTGIA